MNICVADSTVEESSCRWSQFVRKCLNQVNIKGGVAENILGFLAEEDLGGWAVLLSCFFYYFRECWLPIDEQERYLQDIVTNRKDRFVRHLRLVHSNRADEVFQKLRSGQVLCIACLPEWHGWQCSICEGFGRFRS